MSNDLKSLSSELKDILQNEEVIAVDQDSAGLFPVRNAVSARTHLIPAATDTGSLLVQSIHPTDAGEYHPLHTCTASAVNRAVVAQKALRWQYSSCLSQLWCLRWSALQCYVFVRNGMPLLCPQLVLP